MRMSGSEMWAAWLFWTPEQYHTTMMLTCSCFVRQIVRWSPKDPNLYSQRREQVCFESDGCSFLVDWALIPADHIMRTTSDCTALSITACTGKECDFGEVWKGEETGEVRSLWVDTTGQRHLLQARAMKRNAARLSQKHGLSASALHLSSNRCFSEFLSIYKAVFKRASSTTSILWLLTYSSP